MQGVVGGTHVVVAIALRIARVLKGYDTSLVQRSENAVEPVAIRNGRPRTFLSADRSEGLADRVADRALIELTRRITRLAHDLDDAVVIVEPTSDERLDFS